MTTIEELCSEELYECYKICNGLKSSSEKQKCKYMCRKKGRPTVTALLAMFK